MLGVPHELKAATDHSVFYYSSDLEGPAVKLAQILKSICKHEVPCLNPWCQEDFQAADKITGGVTWLVGHGLNGDSKIGTKANRTKALELKDILEWCVH